MMEIGQNLGNLKGMLHLLHYISSEIQHKIKIKHLSNFLGLFHMFKILITFWSLTGI